MPYLGSKTVADCRQLALTLHPKVRGLRAGYDRVRPQWEARDPVGARRYGKDLGQLEARWRTAVKAAQKVRVSSSRDARTTFADKPHAKLIRAVRQGGLAAPVRSGDLSELSGRLHRAYDRLRPTAFGYDALDPYCSAMTSGGPSEGGPEGSGLTKSVADCAALVGRYGDAVNRAIAESGRGPCADWQDALTLLALKAGDPTLAAHPPADIAATVAANEDLASTPADEVYSLLVRVVSDWLPGAARGSFGHDGDGLPFPGPCRNCGSTTAGWAKDFRCTCEACGMPRYDKGAPTVEAARRAKNVLAAQLERQPWLRGIGIGGRPGCYAVKVNVGASAPYSAIPRTVAGVPTLIDVVGDIRPFGLDPSSIAQGLQSVESTVSNAAAGGPRIGFDWTSPVQSLQAYAGAIKNLLDCKELIDNYSVQIPALADRLGAAASAWQAADPSGYAAFAASYGQLTAQWGAAVGAAQARINSQSQIDLSSTAAPSEYAALLSAADQFNALSSQLDQQASTLGAKLPAAPAAVQPAQNPSSAFLQQTSAAIQAARDAAAGIQKETKGEWDDVAPWVKGGVVVAAVGVIGYALAQVATVGGLLKGQVAEYASRRARH